MVKLNKYVDGLEEVLERLEEKIEALEEKIEAIDEKCSDADRDYTESENNRILKYTEQIEELEAERDDIENALEYLREYTENEE